MMDYLNYILSVMTVIAGGGWFINYRANKRQKSGEATQAEADGWKSMQDLYQQTIEDFKNYSEDMRAERGVLKSENNEMREKYKVLEDEMLELKRRLSRMGRKLEALTPFLCSVIGCKDRRRENLSVFASDKPKENNNEDFKEDEQ